MSQAVTGQDTAATLQAMYAPIRREMADIEEMLRLEIRNPNPNINEMVGYGCPPRGKRLRPALLLMTGKAVGGVRREHVVLGAVVEMIHTATLIHDDVLDQADMRRHLATCNARWDNTASVLVGDYLFSHAFCLAGTLEDPYACRTISQATNVICEGELHQINNRGNFALDEDEYLRIVEAKTAELCACSCRLGAHYAGATPEIVERMARFGRDIGTAFQIADDLLDLLGNEATVGKSLGTDLEQLKPTLPLIRLMDVATDGQRDRIRSILTAEDNHRAAALVDWFDRFDAFDYTRSKARYYADRACETIDGIPDSPAKRSLRQVTEFVVSRSL